MRLGLGAPARISIMRSMAWLASWTWPAVRMKRIGRPCALAAMWILLVKPPRERPRAWVRAPFSAGGLLVGAHDGAVEHDVLVVRVRHRIGEAALPDTGLGPAPEALLDAIPLAAALRQVRPARSGTQDP